MMKRFVARSFALMLVTAIPLLVDAKPGHALGSFGSGVDTFCQAYNGTTPYADQSCALCHVNGVPPALNSTGTLYKNNGFAPSAAMCPVKNTAPVANAGANQTVTIGTTVTLNGTASSDVDGNPLTYRWSLTSVPTGSGATLAGATTAKPTFLADKPGQYVAQLIVNDGMLSSAPASVTVSTANTAPVANAGPNQTATIGATVTLNGSGSSDADGNLLTYQWSFASVPTGSTATLMLPTTMKPTFIVDRAGDYVVRLIVNDAMINSAPATVTITTSNTAPISNAGPDQTATAGSTVTLNGSGSSDADGNPLTYDWSLVSVPVGSTATLSNPTAAKPTFIADKIGQYVAQLIVNDGTVNGIPDTVTITTTGINTAPVANAGPDQTVPAGATVQLDGSGSKDADGNALRYQWALTVKPVGSKATLANSTTMMASFVADVAGQYMAQLTVNDGMVGSTPDTVTITTVGGNTAPVANAGPDQTVNVGTLVTLDGSASNDADGTAISFQWALMAKPVGSKAALSNPGTIRPTMTIDVSGDYVVQLIVNDGTASSSPDTVTIKTATSAPNPGIYVPRAKWTAPTAKLMASGRAPKNAAVQIRDADSGTVLSTVESGDTGHFRAYFTPPFIPCAIQAAANGLLSEKTPVAGAPANCGVNSGTPVLQKEMEHEDEESLQPRRRRTSR